MHKANKKIVSSNLKCFLYWYIYTLFTYRVQKIIWRLAGTKLIIVDLDDLAASSQTQKKSLILPGKRRRVKSRLHCRMTDAMTWETTIPTARICIHVMGSLRSWADRSHLTTSRLTSYRSSKSSSRCSMSTSLHCPSAQMAIACRNKWVWFKCLRFICIRLILNDNSVRTSQ